MPFDTEFTPGQFERFHTEEMVRWYPAIILISGFYLLFIRIGEKIMADREPLRLPGHLSLWNICVTFFTWTAVLRTGPSFIGDLFTNGVHHHLCVPDFFDGITGFWSIAFAFSKVLEMGDTVFLVLRKKPVTFLHQYHHASVLIFTWQATRILTAAGRTFAWMNLVVHAVMYPYYLARSLGLRPPRPLAQVITTLQITQMIIGCGVITCIAYYKVIGRYCAMTDETWAIGFFIYGSYLVLFLEYFYGRYYASKDKPQTDNPLNEKLADCGGSGDTPISKKLL